MNRRHFLLLAVTSLAACSFAPDRAPDVGLLTLAARLRADASQLEATRPDFAEICRRDADSLLDEAQRLCGHFSDGSAPQSCSVPEELPLTESSGELGETAAFIADNLAALDQSSIPLVTKIYTELVVLSEQPGELPGGDVAGDSAAVAEVLQGEYGTEYGLSVASAYAELGLDTQIATAITQHRETIAALQALLVDAPVADAGYTFEGYPTPVDSATALAATKQLQDDATARFSAAAAAATTPAWRRFCVIAAGRAALQATPFL